MSEQKMQSDSELVHFGVKGMRWGTRKKPTSSKNAAGNARSTPMRKVKTKSNGARVIEFLGSPAARISAGVLTGAMMLYADSQGRKISNLSASTRPRPYMPGRVARVPIDSIFPKVKVPTNFIDVKSW